MIALITIFVGALLCLYLGIKKQESFSIPIALITLAAAMTVTVIQLLSKDVWPIEMKMRAGGMMLFDFSSQLFSLLLMLSLFLILLSLKPVKMMGADLLGLLMFSLCGGILLSGFTHLVMMFLGIEILSIPLYVLAGANKKDSSSNEAAIKYFLMGAFSTAILLMGCAFIYGGTGSLDLEGLNKASYMMGHMNLATPLVFSGVLLILVGLLFKVAAIPFHFWSPDVYEGSPNRATVFMATIVKAAAFAGFIRLFAVGFGELKEPVWMNAVIVASAISIILGNAAASMQTNAKRLLAYSGIAQTGYMLIAFIGLDFSANVWNLLIYLTGYISATLLVFTIIDILDSEGKASDLKAFEGLGVNNKGLTFALIVAMFSMIGIPLTIGFVGKYAILTAAFYVKPWLVVAALVGSAIGIGVYFNFFKYAVMSRTDKPLPKLNTTAGQKITVAFCTLVILLIGAMPMIIANFKELFF